MVNVIWSIYYGHYRTLWLEITTIFSRFSKTTLVNNDRFSDCSLMNLYFETDFYFSKCQKVNRIVFYTMIEYFLGILDDNNLLVQVNSWKYSIFDRLTAQLRWLSRHEYDRFSGHMFPTLPNLEISNFCLVNKFP